MNRKQLTHRNVLLLVTLLVGLPQGPAANAQSTDESSKKTQVTPMEPSAVWRCKTHTEVQRPKAGKCPICGLKLQSHSIEAGVQEQRSIEELLRTAMKSNSEVRAAELKIRLAQAEYEQAKLRVARQLIDYRQRWKVQHAVVENAKQEVSEVRSAQPTPSPLLNAAMRQLRYAEAKLAEIEAELPFLLGSHFDAEPNGREQLKDASKKLIRERLIPRARQIVELHLREYQTGKANVLALTNAHCRLASLELRASSSAAERNTAIETKRQLLKSTRDVVQEMYAAGRAAQSDVLMLDQELDELELLQLQTDVDGHRNPANTNKDE